MNLAEEIVIVLADRTDEPQIRLLREKLAEIRVVAVKSAAELSAAERNATVLANFSGSRESVRAVFEMCPNLRWVHSRSVGLDRMLFPELVVSNVLLTNGSGVFSAALAEFTIGAILYFAKDFRRLIRNQSSKIWEQFDVERVEGRTLGIVGYGDIGRAIACRAHALGMHVFGLRRSVPASFDDEHASRIYTRNQTCEMVAQCDYVAVAAPLTAETRGIVGSPEIAAMRANAVLINVGRGPLIDESELIRALNAKRIRGAALDVFNEEPLPADHPFYSLENVLLSPHSADHTHDWLDNSTVFFVEQFKRYIRGERLQNVVDKELGY